MGAKLPRERGGLGLPLVGAAACYEAMNESIFGPVCFNCAAPDDGNMRVLATIGTAGAEATLARADRRRRVRQRFAMTEPHPGSGSDPSMMRTRAERGGDRWVISGRKWFITGAGVAQHFILMARTSDDPRKGLTAFLFDRDQPGWRDRPPHPDHGTGGARRALRARFRRAGDSRRGRPAGRRRRPQGHADPARPRAADALHALARARQARLAIALDYVTERESGGRKLADLESVQRLLGEAAMQIEIGRLLTMRAAAEARPRRLRPQGSLDGEGRRRRCAVKAADTAIQLCGARGYSKDTVLEWIYRYARQAAGRRRVGGAQDGAEPFLLDEGDRFWSWS